MRTMAKAGIGGAVVAALAGSITMLDTPAPRVLRTAGPDTVEANFPVTARAGWYVGNKLVALATVQKTSWQTGDVQSLDPQGWGKWYARRVGVVQVCANSEGQQACKFITIYPPVNYPKVWVPSDSNLQPTDSIGGCARVGFGKFLRQSHDTAFFDYTDSVAMLGNKSVCVPYNMYLAVYQSRGAPDPRIMYPDIAPMRPGYKPYGENWMADTAFVGKPRRFGYGGG